MVYSACRMFFVCSMLRIGRFQAACASHAASYLRINESWIVFVVMRWMCPSLTICWNVPASWSAWMCVRMIVVIARTGIPLFCHAARMVCASTGTARHARRHATLHVGDVGRSATRRMRCHSGRAAVRPVPVQMWQR